MNKIDLHTHTTASDGKNSPTENVELAKKKGLRAIAITDHDTVSGIEEALQAGQRLGVEVIPGIEVSTLYNGQDIHVLGYCIKYESKELAKELLKLRETRNIRNKMMVERLKEVGVEITLEEVEARQTTKGGNVGRPHMAEVMMEKGYISTMEEAFEKYLGREGKAYVNPPRISPQEGIELIRKFNGIPVLAHPGLYDQDELIQDLQEEGLKGIEVYHPDHSEAEVKKYKRFAEDLNLVATGGSDFHGVRNGKVFHGELGSQPVEYTTLEELRLTRSKA